MAAFPLAFNTQTAIQRVPERRRLLVLLLAWVLLCPCVGYALLADAPLVAWLAAAALAVSVALPRAVPITSRAVIYALTIAGTFAVLLNQAYPVADDRFFLPAPVLFPFLIAVAVAATLFPQTPSTLSIILGAVLVALMVMGSTLQDPHNARLVITSHWWSNRYAIFGVVLLGVAPAFLLTLRQAQWPTVASVTTAVTRRGWLPLVLYGGAVVLAAAATLGMIIGASPVYHKLDKVLTPILQWYIRQAQGRIIFPGDKVSLTQTFDAKSAAQEHLVVLRARSTQPPGYLRGRAYSLYEGGSWRGQDMGVELPRQEAAGALVTHRYSRPEFPAALTQHSGDTTVDIYPAQRFESDVLLAAGEARTVELIAESLQTNADGCLGPKRWDASGGYTYAGPHLDQTSAYPYPAAGAPAPADLYLGVPPELRGPLHELNAAIFPTPGLTTQQQLRGLASFLQNHYDYQLGIKPKGDRDPVLQFLLEIKKGHCEFFASAGALLLREHGIRTRYVTGFVCLEPHPRQGYWLARLSDCHAWVEAYVPETGRWQVVEATPASGLPTQTSRAGWFNERVEQVLVAWQALFAKVKRGYVAEAVVEVLSSLGLLLSWLFWRGPWPLSWGTLLLGGWLLWRWRRRRPRARALAATLRELTVIRQQLERLLAHDRRQRRPAAMSLREWAETLPLGTHPRAELLLPLVADYERLRYAPAPPPPAAVSALAARVAQVRQGGATPV